MKYTIQNMKVPFIFFENKKEMRFTRYAFIDESGKCIIIVIGEGKRDSMAKYLEKNTSRSNTSICSHSTRDSIMVS
jgi:hypothetical protein